MENEIKEQAHEAEDASKSNKRKVVVPGEVIVSGEDFLPGEGTKRSGEDVIAIRFGLSEEVGRVVKVIPIFGTFLPRRGNVVIARVIDLTHAGWILDIDAANSAFLSIEEYPKFVKKSEMEQHLKVGDVISAKIWSTNGRSIDLSMKGRGLSKLEGGFIFRVIPSRVPRIIGREGSMINLIKDKTGCTITVGQNGWVWIKGPSTDAEIKARKAIQFVAEKVHIGGLTEKMEAWFEEN